MHHKFHDERIRIMARNFFVFMFMILAIAGFSQTKSDAMLFGDIKSKVTGEHIPFVSILVKGTNIGTMSDGTGHFKLANLPLGSITVVARATGFKTEQHELFMERDKAVTLFIELDVDIIELDQIVITGTRTEHTVRDVPVKTGLITSGDIENRNASNLFEALECTPGVRVESQCQSCNFSMVRMQGLGAEHTQILINGQPVYSGLAGVYGLQQVSTVDIGRIEVVKGAGSALYGSSAIAGAINIITREPSFSPSATVDIQIGNHNNRRYDISSSMRNDKGNIGLMLFARRLVEGVIDETGEGDTRDEVRGADGISDRVATNLTNAGFGLFIDNALFRNDKLIIRGKSIFETRDGGVIIDDQYRNPFTEGTESITTERYEAEINYSKPLRQHLMMQLSVAYVNHKRNATSDAYLTDFMEMHNDDLPDLRDMRPYLASENSLISTLTLGRTFGRHHFLGGIQTSVNLLEESGMYVIVDEESPFAGESYGSVADKRAREIGVFIQDEWRVSEKLMLVPGIRADHHKSGESYRADKQVFLNDQFPSTSFERPSVNPRIALKYEISNRFTFRANAGTGFRAPFGFSEDLHLCSGSPRVWKSSDLNPETSVSYNISFDYYGVYSNISTNIFRTNLRNKIGFTTADEEIAALGYDYQWVNIDDALVQGVEFSFQTKLWKRWSTGFDLTWNHGEYLNIREEWAETQYAEMSRKISRFPATTGNLRFEYRRQTWNVLLTGSYQGRMYIDYQNDDIDPVTGDISKIKETDPFMLFNISAGKSLDKFRFYGGVKNIFNYIQDERRLDDPAFLYAPVYGRTLYAGIKYSIR